MHYNHLAHTGKSNDALCLILPNTHNLLWWKNRNIIHFSLCILKPVRACVVSRALVGPCFWRVESSIPFCIGWISIYFNVKIQTLSHGLLNTTCIRCDSSLNWVGREHSQHVPVNVFQPNWHVDPTHPHGSDDVWGRQLVYFGHYWICPMSLYFPHLCAKILCFMLFLWLQW